MGPPTLTDLLASGEGETLEFKTSLADSRKIIETAAAMATRGGGTILIGVKDDRTVVGANLGAGEVERLVQQVLANTDPRLYLHIEDLLHDGRRVLRLEVPPGDGPHLAFGRALHRVGPATVAMTRDEYERRLLDRLRESSGFERRTLEGATTEELDPEIIRAWAKLAKGRLKNFSGEEPPNSIIERLHLVHGPQVTVAGWLLFSSEPDARLPQATIRALAERGAARDTKVITGPATRQIEEALEFVVRNLKVRTSVAGARRVERAELPAAAVREVIANAVAHRDYRSTAAIQLRVSDDGLEIWNAGALPPPLTPALLRERHPSVPPNPLLARALFLAGYIEEWGTGTLTVIDLMRENGNPEPRFEDASAGIRVVLPFKGSGVGALSAREQAGLKGMKVGQSFSSADYARRAGVSARTAGTDLVSLEARGLVIRTGVGRATRWRRI
jgi:ATP-dependent DNA helicase RecG